MRKVHLHVNRDGTINEKADGSILRAYNAFHIYNHFMQCEKYKHCVIGIIGVKA